MTRRSVCFIRHGYFPQDPRVRKEVLALAEAGFDVDVVCLRDAGETPEETWNGVSVHRLPVRHLRGSVLRYLAEYASFFVLALLRVGALNARRKFALVQVNTMPDVLVFASLVPRLGGSKVVLDMHELMPEFFRAKYRSRAARAGALLISLAEKVSIAFADIVIVPSDVRKEIILNRGTPPWKMSVIHNAPEEGAFSGGGPEQEERWHVVAHGTITEMYGFQTLVRAVPAIRASVPGFRALIVGGGEYLGELKALAESLGVSGAVEFTGRVPFDEVAGYLRRSMIGVIPIRKDEFTEFAAPNKLFEYIALRKPVVCTDLAGIREYVGPDEAVFVRSEDADDLAVNIVALLNDPARRRRLAEAAWQSYQRVRWNVNKIEYANLIRRAIG